MVDVFISYSRENRGIVEQLAEGVARLGYSVWWDEDLPPHLSYSDVIAQQIRGAKAAIVVWSSRAGASQWVRAEADLAREEGKLIQASVDNSTPPMPFNQIQFVAIGDWRGEDDHPGWRKIKASLLALCGPGVPAAAAAAPAPPPPAPATAAPLATAAPPPTAAPKAAPPRRRRARASPVLIGVVVLSAAVLIAVGVLTLLRRPAAAPAPVVLPSQLVTIGGAGPYRQACRSGRVGNLNPSGDNFLALRGRPGRNEEKLAELGPNRSVLICDSASADGQTWFGIVYGPEAPGRDCGVALPAPRPQPYRGPCGSGWVRSRYVNISP